MTVDPSSPRDLLEHNKDAPRSSAPLANDSGNVPHQPASMVMSVKIEEPTADGQQRRARRRSALIPVSPNYTTRTAGPSSDTATPTPPSTRRNATTSSRRRGYFHTTPTPES